MADQTRDPTSDIAEAGGITGASAGTRYTLVDDHPDSGGTDLMVLTNNVAEILFGTSAFTVPAGATGISVAVKMITRREGSGGATCRAKIRVNSTDYYSSTHAPANGVLAENTDTWATNPDTSAAWTITDVNTLIGGFGVDAVDGDPNISVASIQMVASYTPSAGTADIELNWDDLSTIEDGFKIERKTGAGAYSQIDTVAADVSTYQDTVNTGATYTYRVRSYNANGNSSYSNEDTVVVP